MRLIDLQNWIFSELISQAQVLKFEVSDVEFKPFALQGEAPGFELLPDYRSQR